MSRMARLGWMLIVPSLAMLLVVVSEKLVAQNGQGSLDRPSLSSHHQEYSFDWVLGSSSVVSIPLPVTDRAVHVDCALTNVYLADGTPQSPSIEQSSIVYDSAVSSFGITPGPPWLQFDHGNVLIGGGDVGTPSTHSIVFTPIPESGYEFSQSVSAKLTANVWW
jgi:hypothetical protein